MCFDAFWCVLMFFDAFLVLTGLKGGQIPWPSSHTDAVHSNSVLATIQMMMTTMVSDAYPGAAGMYGDMGPSTHHFLVD
jgi:hypothetical protein